jgi:D-alanine-D-alanine ligase-like ATP-grasp enzyme
LLRDVQEHFVQRRQAYLNICNAQLLLPALQLLEEALQTIPRSAFHATKKKKKLRCDIFSLPCFFLFSFLNSVSGMEQRRHQIFPKASEMQENTDDDGRDG